MVSCWGVTKHIQSKSMTTHRTDPELLNTVVQLLTEQGASNGLAEGIRLLVNEAMRQERSQALQARPYERTQTRQGHANGFKPKTLGTRVGPIQFQVPQVRGGLEFYPSALEKGVRSEPERSRPRRGAASAQNWSRAGHNGFLLGCQQTHPKQIHDDPPNRS